jgi:hypothetical protein
MDSARVADARRALAALVASVADPAVPAVPSSDLRFDGGNRSADALRYAAAASAEARLGIVRQLLALSSALAEAERLPLDHRGERNAEAA